MASGDYKFWVSWISFQKSNISWPQQPPTGKALKFNLIFHDSSKIIFVSKHQNNAEFKNLDDSKVLSSDFLDFRTSAASMTSTASTTSMASMTSTVLFHQKTFKLEKMYIFNGSLFFITWKMHLEVKIVQKSFSNKRCWLIQG